MFIKWTIIKTILKIINKNPNVTQRELSSELGLSLGKINFCLQALKAKGLIKMKNFNQSTKKLNYIYFLTPKGITEKTRLTIDFMKRKMQEYKELKIELENNKFK